jgi:hypothetical protein
MITRYGCTAPELVGKYFGPFEPRLTGVLENKRIALGRRRQPWRVGFTGRYFDELVSHRSEDSLKPDERDLAAVSCLSIRVTGDMVGSLLSRAETIGNELQKVTGLSRASQIWETDCAWLKENGDIAKSRDLIRDLWGFGDTTAHKVMAAMFPHLLPVKDSWVVEVMAKAPADENWWQAWKSVCDDKLRTCLNSVLQRARSTGVGVPKNMSLLRVADIVIWTGEYGLRNKSVEL